MPTPAATLPAEPQRTPASAAAPPQRLVSLDAFRGFVMFAMASNGLALASVARNFPDSRPWQIIAYQFDHAAWIGCAVWDLIQPSFMFMVGVAMAYSCASRHARGQTYGQMARHAAWRSVVLVALGIFLRSHAGETNFTFEDVVTQIGLGYFFLFLLWNRPAAVQLAAAAAVLLGDWLLFRYYPLPPADFDYGSVGVPADWPHLPGAAAHWDKNTNVAAAADVWFLNLFPRSEPFKFNVGGYQTLNFLPSLATMIFGLVTGELLRGGRSTAAKLGLLVGAGAAGLLLGWGLDAADVCPLVKRIWTPSWALFSAGWALWMLAGFYLVVDVLGFRRWTFPFVVVGMNSIVMYVMAELMTGWLADRLQLHLGQGVFSLWGHASEIYIPLVQQTAVLGLMWLICYWLYRQKISCAFDAEQPPRREG